MEASSFQFSWIRSTFAGWALGIPAIVLFSSLAEGLGQHSLNVPVGAGMGLTVGFFQARVLRHHLGRPYPWFLSCFVGLSLPFLVSDLARWAGLSVPYSLYVAVICGGLVVGSWQAILLRSAGARAVAWIVASSLGWLLASGSVALADALVRARAIRGIPGALSYLGLVASGGILIALVTGVVLVRLLRLPQAT